MGLTLEQIAKETRIGTRFLDAIEREDFQILPGGIFSRGFIRSFAERLEMDPDQAVSEFDRRINYKAPAILETLSASEPPAKTANKSLLPIAAGAGLLAILVIVFYVVTRLSPGPATASQSAVPPPATVAAQPAPAGETPSPTTPSETAAAPDETAPAATTDAQPVAQQPVSPPPTVATAAPALAPAAAPNGVLTLVVEAKELTWVKILGDRAVLMNELLQPGTTRRFTAQKSFGIITGNAGGLSLKLNDHDMAPLGKSGQVRQITITPENLKDFIG